MKTLPRLLMAYRVDRMGRVRLHFNDGLVKDVRLPVKTRVQMTCDGNGLRFAPGVRGEVAAWLLYHMRGRVLAKPVMHNVDRTTPAAVAARYSRRTRAA